MEIVLLVLLTFAGLTGIGVLGVFGLNLVGRMRSAPNDSKILLQRLDDIEQRLDGTDERLELLPRFDEQILDLEERIEFTERLLQQNRERDRLPPAEG